MKTRQTKLLTGLLIFLVIGGSIMADQRGKIYRLGSELERLAIDLALNSYDHFKSWGGEINEREQGVLFKSASFVASSQLFLKLTKGDSDYFGSRYVRTNLYNAFIYLAGSFNDLEKECQDANIRPYALHDIHRILERMEREFARWPSPQNLAYLDGKYVKARNASVYLIQRRETGVYIRRPFKDIESLYRYNYDLNRGKDPWKYLVEVSEDTLMKMDKDSMIVRTFNGHLIIEQSNRPNRPVFLIERGKKRGLTSPQVVQRYGGWKNVFEVPIEVINKYPEGEPIR
jgi:hypothetical protein